MEQSISYRDKDGFVVMSEYKVKRYLCKTYAGAYEHLMLSGLYQKLIEEVLLINHREQQCADTDYHKILEPEIIPFISLPCEWTASQWKEVVLTLLRINCIAAEYGMILKDATPYNFAFHKGHCILFDTGSFELYKEGDPWIAYRQFCETMLGPLALSFFTDTSWIGIMQSNVNGLPLSFLSRNLPFTTWLNPVLLLHIHWHARTGVSRNKKVKNSGLTKEKLLLLWEMMARSIRKWKLPVSKAVWEDYYDTSVLSDAYLAGKERVVENWLQSAGPERVVDLGANNGIFSFMASKYAEKVLAIEMDHGCLETMRTGIRQNQYANIETVAANIASPTPATGWNNEEHSSLLQRLHCDMLLELAVIHHLCIAANIPFSFIAKMSAQITSRYLIAEFVPKSDPRVTEMLCNRKDVFDDYTEAAFLTAYSRYFVLKEEAACDDSNRKLYLWERK